MIIANTEVVTGGTTYKQGQTIPGLSQTDKEWLVQNGFATKADEAVNGKTAKKKTGKKSPEVKANGES